ncbi:unnamed protein product [Malassezia sympodialis ATCC 42132]|uniref:Uncharacterized protein n=1 Tax=Malassezia sympodialis (strain ATCC 42132) TaxID=1230383 RepID=M5EJJ8_MALS4|nr:uncharacterized protein MSY001_0521 [Malassezia sympodialis ATCC 42132]CCU97815.1 unnamed protein product [Malassezia sympodialis ATCC 42132]SHO77812.1 Hypothetical protein MSYG_2154 [Malassezia sympodialis ATCC 42132]|eukprot:XP_018739149.1 uncharacterized protein MSY001_0521 [Malassezia sympodialis ATCC 42132]
MQDEGAAPFAAGSVPPSDAGSPAAVPMRSTFSCSPRDFRLPLAPMEAESPRVHARRYHARKLSSAPRDKNKMRVAELLQDERCPVESEVASEARLQRRLVGETSPHDLVSRRARRARLAGLWGEPVHEAQSASLFGELGPSHLHVVTHDDDMDDPLDGTSSTPLDDMHSSSDDMSDEEPRACDIALDESFPPPAAPVAPFSEPLWMPGASPRLGTKRKHDESTPYARRRPPAPVAPWLLSGASSPRSMASPRRPFLFGHAAVSPSSSPLALSALSAPRRTPTPVHTASVPHSPHDEPMSPSMTPWKPLARSPSAGAGPLAGSGPGYGSVAIGLRIGSRTAWDAPHLDERADGGSMDEGVRLLGLT